MGEVVSYEIERSKKVYGMMLKDYERFVAEEKECRDLIERFTSLLLKKERGEEKLEHLQERLKETETWNNAYKKDLEIIKGTLDLMALTFNIQQINVGDK